MARGVKKGDRVGIWSPNRYEWVVVQFATAAMGAILVNMNPADRTSELEYALNQSGITFLILAAGFARPTTAQCSSRSKEGVLNYVRRLSSRTVSWRNDGHPC